MKQDRVGIGDRLPGFGHAYPVPLTHVVSAELRIHIHPVRLQMYTVPTRLRGPAGQRPRTPTPMHEGVRGQHPGMQKPGDPRRVQTRHPRLSVVATIGYGAFLAGPAIIGFVGDYVGVLRAVTVVGRVSALALLVVPTARPLRWEAASASQ